MGGNITPVVIWRFIEGCWGVETCADRIKGGGDVDEASGGGAL